MKKPRLCWSGRSAAQELGLHPTSRNKGAPTDRLTALVQQRGLEIPKRRKPRFDARGSPALAFGIEPRGLGGFVWVYPPNQTGRAVKCSRIVKKESPGRDICRGQGLGKSMGGNFRPSSIELALAPDSSCGL
jgi:hypothetical protein